MNIGVDFDNTIVTYDGAFRAAAVNHGWLPAGAAGDRIETKRAVRDYLRRQGPNGESRWQALQFEVYTSGLETACLAPDARQFFRWCHAEGHRVFIISHKSEYAATDVMHTSSMRHAARAWLAAQGLFDTAGLGVLPTDVFFEDTRLAKLARIAAMGCAWFIDDLPETFAERSFPERTRKVLLSATALNGLPCGVQLCRGWSDVLRVISTREPGRTNIPAQACAEVERFLDCRLVELAQLHGGRNSRTFKAVTDDDQLLAIKQYFQHPADPRDRGATEFSALALLCSNGFSDVPRPVKLHPDHTWAAYEFVAGTPPSLPPTTADIHAAVKFATRLRRLRLDGSAAAPASDACFCLDDVCACVDRRRQRFEDCQAPDLRGFLDGAFLSAWTAAYRRAETCLGIEPPLPQKDRCLSPSDFGFHNAIRRPDGRLTFVDFEYFGWDDPVKMVADFLLHPAMHLDPEQGTAFRDGVVAELGIPDLRRRLDAMLPLFALNWCLILLNEFLCSDGSRRTFAGSVATTMNALREEQFAKAEAMLQRALAVAG